MATICFYQDGRHATPLYWIQKTLGCGYVAERNDGMTELRINSFVQVHEVLVLLSPYLRFKKVQAKVLRDACAILMADSFRTLSVRDLKRIVASMLVMQSENYASRKKKTKEELYTMLGLTP